MYFPDLTEGKYFGLSVGWLDRAHDYPRGPVPAGFLEALGVAGHNCAVRHKGSHICELCPSPQWAAAGSCRELPDGTRLTMGNGVIRVWSRSGKAYVAPNLIYHYVEVHKYQPPTEFIEAVMSPGPPGRVHLTAMQMEGFFRFFSYGLTRFPPKE
jgi:hypothetical protein